MSDAALIFAMTIYALTTTFGLRKLARLNAERRAAAIRYEAEAAQLREWWDASVREFNSVCDRLGYQPIREDRTVRQETR